MLSVSGPAFGDGLRSGGEREKLKKQEKKKTVVGSSLVT